MNLYGYNYYIVIFTEVYDFIYYNVYTAIEFIFIRKLQLFQKIIFKNKNVLYIIYEIYFYKKVMSLQILKITDYSQSRKKPEYTQME